MFLCEIPNTISKLYKCIFLFHFQHFKFVDIFFCGFDRLVAVCRYVSIVRLFHASVVKTGIGVFSYCCTEFQVLSSLLMLFFFQLFFLCPFQTITTTNNPTTEKKYNTRHKGSGWILLLPQSLED